jgi:hypothetical protein
MATLGDAFDLVARDENAWAVFTRVAASAERAAEATRRAIRAGESLKEDRDGGR